MKLKLLLVLLLPTTLSTAQTLADTQRVALRVLAEAVDTVYVKVRRDAKGQIKYLEQAYTAQENGRTYMYGEHYRRGKYWFRTRYLERWENNKRGNAKLGLVCSGSWPEYNQRWQLKRLLTHRNDELENHSYAYSYYPSGKFRFLAEFRNDRVYNFLAYHYPDGRDFDFGDFYDGQGSFQLLTDQGQLCEPCRTDPELFLAFQIDPALFEKINFHPFEEME